MHPIWFLTFLTLTVLEAAALLCSASMPMFIFLPFAFVLILVPATDAFTLINVTSANATQQNLWSRRSVWFPPLAFYSLTHFALLALATYEIKDAAWWYVIAASVAIGTYTGGIGITVAHELAHKKDLTSKVLANALLCTVWYQQYFVEHIRGHHFNVATDLDASSAPRGMSIYRFIPRSVLGGYHHALTLETKRLAKTWSLKNHVLQGSAVSIALTVLFAALGLKPLAFFLIQSFTAISLLELANYIEHYGLRRRQLTNGRFEKVLPIHSWNSSHHLSNSLLFNLQRHSDHHAAAHLPFTVLKHHEDAPQLPAGYPTMLLIALVPSLWFRIMDPRIDSWNAQRGHGAI